jgi:putative NADPH-quinone reductase
MRLLIVYCHPDPESYGHALLETAQRALTRAGHTIETIDLYAEGFEPVLSREEKKTYLSDPQGNAAKVQRHVDLLLWAEGLVFVYPTWFYGPPAMLKGWFERVWLPGIAFGVPRYKGDRAQGKLGNIRRVIVITTSGSPWWWLRLIRDPGKNFFTRGLRPLFGQGCRFDWLQLHNMNNATDADRQGFIAKVDHRLSVPDLAS